MLHRTCALASIALALSAHAPIAAAAVAQRTFVSANGSDLNACSIGLPCRSFKAAIAQTIAGGEVIVLDSAGYGPVTITKSVSIIAPAGVYAGISVFSGDGVTVTASSTDSVTLRGLAITAQGGTNGVNFSAGGILEIDRCTISGAFTNGIEINGPLAANVLIKDSQISRVEHVSGYGIHVGGPGGEHIRLAVTDSVLSDVRAGMWVEAGAEVIVENSRFSGIPAGGGDSMHFVAYSALHSPIEAHVTNSFIQGFNNGASVDELAPFVSLSIAASELSHNQYGVLAQRGATIALTGNRVVHNGVAIATSPGGIVYTSGTNYSAYNGSAGDPVTGPAGLF